MTAVIFTGSALKAQRLLDRTRQRRRVETVLRLEEALGTGLAGRHRGPGRPPQAARNALLSDHFGDERPQAAVAVVRLDGERDRHAGEQFGDLGSWVRVERRHDDNGRLNAA